MIRKGVALIGFCIGAWLGYHYAIDLIETTGIDLSDYWGEQGAEFLRIVLTFAFGGGLAVAAYFLANFFARFD